MTVKVKFLGNLKGSVEEGETSFSANSVNELLDSLIEENPELIDKIFEEPSDKKLKGSINILVNGRRMESLHGFDTELEDGDKVVFFPWVGGG